MYKFSVCMYTGHYWNENIYMMEIIFVDKFSVDKMALFVFSDAFCGFHKLHFHWHRRLKLQQNLWGKNQMENKWMIRLKYWNNKLKCKKWIIENDNGRFIVGKMIHFFVVSSINQNQDILSKFIFIFHL